MKALSRVELSGRAFGIAQPLSQVTKKIAGTIVRILADLNVARQKRSLNNRDMVRTNKTAPSAPTKGIGPEANNGRQLRPYR